MVRGVGHEKPGRHAVQVINMMLLLLSSLCSLGLLVSHMSGLIEEGLHSGLRCMYPSLLCGMSLRMTWVLRVCRVLRRAEVNCFRGRTLGYGEFDTDEVSGWQSSGS